MNLQIPDSSSRYAPVATSNASRPVSVAVHPTPTPTSTSSSARRQQRASHTVVSNSQQQSHPPSSSHHHPDDTPPYTDVYSHPAAIAYAAAHPRRTIPKFGPYLLLQTLGEGEFGKVKLGLHSQWGEEVAVKLIRRGNVDNTVRMSKVEREIEVLRTLKHPNIVRLYDVIETDKYIGIILEYASGGELFDHILAHRYLREKDAAKLFSQLISGVWYIHQKKIVHRDLKLENLLLDRHRNVIITDFGFANRFEHRADDLMQTSCGSPCYAAPELVISEGLYVGSAVDIWSCGVILYAMLAGYLPFDDDPANPDGDNINLLYKYIVNTPLSFPDYISAEARDLLSMMLVPDPRHRASLQGVMRHPWLSAYAGELNSLTAPNAFGRTVDELERAAMEQHQQKRLAYQKQMKAAALSSASPAATRSQSQRPDTLAGPTMHPPSKSRSTQPEITYYESPAVDQSYASTAPASTPPSVVVAKKTTYGSPGPAVDDDDPFAPAAGVSANLYASPPATATSSTTKSRTDTNSPKKSPPSSNNAGGFRHTIQVEYDEPQRGGERKARERSGSQGPISGSAPPHTSQQQQNGGHHHARRPSQGSTTTTIAKPLPQAPTSVPPSPPVGQGQGSWGAGRSSASPASKAGTPPRPQPQSAAASATPPTVNIVAVSPPETPIKFAANSSIYSSPAQTGSPGDGEDRRSQASSNTTPTSKAAGAGHKKTRSSVDRMGLGKIFGGGEVPLTNGAGQQQDGVGSAASSVVVGTPGGSSVHSERDVREKEREQREKEKEAGKKTLGGSNSRRNTLTVMVEPFSRSIRNRGGKRGASTPIAEPGEGEKNVVKGEKERKDKEKIPLTNGAMAANANGDATAGFVNISRTDIPGAGAGMQASTSKARKVMEWFRTKSKGRDSVGPSSASGSGREDDYDEEDGQQSRSMVAGSKKHGEDRRVGTSTASRDIVAPPVQVVVTTPTSTYPRPPSNMGMSVSATPTTPHQQQRTPSTATDASVATPSLVTRFRNSVGVGISSPPAHSHRDSPASTKSRAQSGQTLRIHHGAVDTTTITTRPPAEVMRHVREVLESMGVEIQVESDYKFRCIRGKKRKGAGTSAGDLGAVSGGGGLAAVTMVGSAASNGVDKRGLPLPSPSSFASTGGMLRGLLMRRQSSQVSATAYDDETSSPIMVVGTGEASEIAYGDPSQDAGDEVRFSVELTRLDRLNDTFSLDIRRLKGNLRSYKFLYDTLRQRADLQR